MQKRRKTIKIDENFIGRFLTSVGVMDEAKISKEDFINTYRRM
jgi:hypothetical protein